MHLFVFILTFVVNFSFYQAGLLTHENEGFKENGSSHPISTDYTASTYNNQIRNTRQSTYTRISDGPNDIIHIGNGHYKNNILFIQERSRENPAASFPNKETNGGRRTNNDNIGFTENQPSINYHRGNPQGTTKLGNRFGSDVSHDSVNSRPKNTIRTDQSIYTHISDGQKDITQVGNGQNRNNVFNVVEGSYGSREPNNGNIGLRGSHPQTNYKRKSYSQGAPNLGNRFGSNVPHDFDNFHPKTTTRVDQSLYNHFSDGQSDIINIGNGHNKHNVFNVDEGSRGQPQRPYSGNVGSPGNPPATNYYGRNPNPRFDKDYKREQNIFTAIGNGIGNRNTFSIHNNEPNYDNRRRTNTQQNNYEPKSNSWATNTPTNFNKHRYNNPIDTNTFTSIGSGPNNRNTVNVDGKSIRFDSGLIMTTKEQGKGLITPDQTLDLSRGVNNSHPKTITRTDQSLYNHSSDGQRDIINIGNRHHKNNVLNVDEESRGQPQRPQSGKVGSLGNPPKTNDYDTNPNPQFNSDDDMISAIGNGIGNRNSFSIHDNAPNYDNRRRTNTQQNNYEPKTNSWATNTSTNFNQDRYNNPTDTFISIGRGPNNKNTVNIDGKSIGFDSGLAMTKEHQGLGKGLITPDETSDLSRGFDNSHPETTTRTDQSLYNHSSDVRRDIINIGNGHNKHNVFIVDEGSHGQPQRPLSRKVGSPGNPPTTSYYDTNPDSHWDYSQFDSDDEGVKNMITAIRSGIGNRNTFSIDDNEPNYDNQGQTNTQQDNYEPKIDSWATNTGTNFDQHTYKNPTYINTFPWIKINWMDNQYDLFPDWL